MYPTLAGDALSSRGPVQTLRLAMVYALLDSLCIIREEHLKAGLALWHYARESAEITFVTAKQEDPLVALVLDKLKDAGASGLTRTQLRDAFHRNLANNVLLAALATLRNRGQVRSAKEETSGRPRERWFANDNTTERPKGREQGGFSAADGASVVQSFGRTASGEVEVTA